MRTTLNPGQITEEYEALRGQVLRVRGGHGLMIFLTHGMASWMEALSSLKPLEDPSLRSADQGEVLPTEVRTEALSLWTEMVLSCMEQVL